MAPTRNVLRNCDKFPAKGCGRAPVENAPRFALWTAFSSRARVRTHSLKGPVPQRRPVPGEGGLVAGELVVVAGEADRGAQPVFEHVLLRGAPLAAQRLRPVVERRGVVDAEADRDQVVVLVESAASAV